MGVEEHPMHALAAFLPEGTFDDVVTFLHHYKVHLTVTKRRKTVLGDYRHAFRGQNHRITVNSNLNQYEFLITLLHELAHLLTFEQFGNRVEAHGKEWKNHYGQLLRKFIEKKVFPPDIEKALQRSVINPAATANGETALILVLRKYDTQKREGYYHIAELPAGSLFQTDDKKIFRKGEKRRSRYTCTEIKTGLKYSFSPVYEVRLIDQPAG
jgi:SprT protein